MLLPCFHLVLTTHPNYPYQFFLVSTIQIGQDYGPNQSKCEVGGVQRNRYSVLNLEQRLISNIISMFRYVPIRLRLTGSLYGQRVAGGYIFIQHVAETKTFGARNLEKVSINFEKKVIFELIIFFQLSPNLARLRRNIFEAYRNSFYVK